MKRILLPIVCSLLTVSYVMAAEVLRKGQTVEVRPNGGLAKVVQLQVVGDRIVRVRATSQETLPQKQQSLIVVPQTEKPTFSVDETGGSVTIKTLAMQAVVDKHTGELRFLDAAGNVLLNEASQGKRFWPYRVPTREMGVDAARVPESRQEGLQWQMVFDSPDGEAFYGLGQHQSEELNMKGRNEDLFQYNTKVSVPFVISSRNYGLLWDSYSYCRFGMPTDYQQLNRVFSLFDKYGQQGHLTGTYVDKKGNTLVRGEDSIYFEYDLPEKQQAADAGGIKNLPKGFALNGSNVVYEGFLQSAEAHDFQFILYYAGYVKVYIGGQLVVPERWRTAWNPNSYKFSAHIPANVKTQLRIEWEPDGDVSYCGLRVAEPMTEKERGQLSIWSEMAPDMDYYFICGKDMDEVVAGYRTLTGRAPVYPKWTLGYWQSRERYKTSAEIEETLSEFRQRHIPIDNIVQDWNYWQLDSWGDHRFEASRYPNPQAMLDSIHQMHGRFMISVWPKFYDTVENYMELDRKGWIYHQAINDDIHDWLGFRGSFYDAYDAEARKTFWRQMDENLYTGLVGKSQPQPRGTAQTKGRAKANGVNAEHSLIDAWWMDASEPNVRDCTPMWYRKALCGPTALGTSTEYFNAYSLVNADAIYNGQRSVFSSKRQPEPRVFLLTRSGFAGLQRYGAATWSGDIGTRWEDMRAQITAGLNYSLSGLPFWGMDQGGFCVEQRYVSAQQQYLQNGTVNTDLDEWRELQTRWAQFGTFIPLFRSHGQWPLREPWNIAPETHPAYQSFLFYDHLRYRLMPYLYSMAGWVNLKHYTMMRALVMDFGSDINVHDVKDQWMFGPSLMACPVTAYKARSRSVYFPPQCGWYDLYTGRKVIDRHSSTPGTRIQAADTAVARSLMVDAPYGRIPVYVPEGSIIPFGPKMEWSDEKPAELIYLYVYAGRDACFTLYEDEGTNYNYEKGLCSTIDITYSEEARTLIIGKRNGSFPGMLKQRRFCVVYVTDKSAVGIDKLLDENLETVSYTGKALTISLH